MNRPSRYKLAYAAVAGILLTLGMIAAKAMGGTLAAWVAVVLALLMPGRIQAYFYRDLIRGRRLLDSGRGDEAVAYFERFLADLERWPVMRQMLWLSWSIYTPSAEAMTLNNLGAAWIQVGRMDRARKALDAALSHDPLYPFPHQNLAIIHAVNGDRDAAAAALKSCHELGHAGESLDAVLAHADGLRASLKAHDRKTRRSRRR